MQLCKHSWDFTETFQFNAFFYLVCFCFLLKQTNQEWQQKKTVRLHTISSLFTMLIQCTRNRNREQRAHLSRMPQSCKFIALCLRIVNKKAARENINNKSPRHPSTQFKEDFVHVGQERCFRARNCSLSASWVEQHGKRFKRKFIVIQF